MVVPWWDMCGMNDWRKLHIPRNYYSFMILFGDDMSKIAWILAGHGLMPELVNWHPYIVILVFWISPLNELNARQFLAATAIIMFRRMEL